MHSECDRPPTAEPAVSAKDGDRPPDLPICIESDKKFYDRFPNQSSVRPDHCNSAC
ncbi:MAG: hypothetical protein HC910_17185 [Spirulinaceae cyanobacterium SM2_1_0]|nr:hypothetical protein [Spirulinaceae cyanobacterium SM2_1_0]